MSEETALLLHDLYESLCILGENEQSPNFKRRLRKLYLFFHAFIACWRQSESCPVIPIHLESIENTCEYVKDSIDWLSMQGYEHATKMFKRLIRNNLDTNVALLMSFNITDDDILQLNNFVELENLDLFQNKMQEITDKLMYNNTTAVESMTLLGIMGSLTFSKIPSSNQHPRLLTPFEMNNLENGDILFKIEYNDFAKINPLTLKYSSSNDIKLKPLQQIQNTIPLYPGQFIINDGFHFYKMESNLVDTTNSIQFDFNGQLFTKLWNLRLNLNKNIVVIFIKDLILQLDLTSGFIMMHPFESDAFESNIRNFQITNHVSDGQLSIFVQGSLIAIPIIIIKSFESMKADNFINHLNEISHKVHLDLTSETLL
jgi:hypothetical protein